MFESQTRIRIARTAHTAVGALSSQFAATLECGVRLQRDLGYPETYPKKVVAAGGCPRTSLEHRRARKWLSKPNLQRFVGCLWTLLDVYGRPRMAPRAGFEVSRNLLNRQVLLACDELNTPSDTPRGLWIVQPSVWMPSPHRSWDRAARRTRVALLSYFNYLILLINRAGMGGKWPGPAMAISEAVTCDLSTKSRGFRRMGQTAPRRPLRMTECAKSTAVGTDATLYGVFAASSQRSCAAFLLAPPLPL